MIGLGHAQLVEEDGRHQPVVVLAGVDEHVPAASGRRRCSAAITGAVFTKFGRVPTT